MATRWNAGKVVAALSALDECLPVLRDELRDALNDYHGVRHSTQYYDVLAGDWLELFAHAVYAARQDCLAGHGPAVDRQAIPVAADNRSSLRSAMEDEQWHEHLRWAIARLLEGHTPDRWRFQQSEVIVASGDNGKLSTSGLVRGFSTTQPKLLLSAPYFKCSRTEWLAAMWRWRHWARWDDIRYPFDFKCIIDYKWRSGKAAQIDARDLVGLLRALLPLHIPAVLVEGFGEFEKKVQSLGVPRPRAAYTANALHGHMAFKFLAAQWQEEGTPLLCHQHGGGYGLDRIHAPERFESRVADRFYTWGWGAAGQRMRPLSSPAMPRIRTDKRRQVLLNCVVFPRHVYRLHFHPMPGTIETLLDETVAFSAAIAGKRSLLVRLYQSDWGWGMAQAIRSAAPGVSFDDARANAFTRYAESELVVHNYLGTSWLETLAMNIPTVCIFDPETYAFRSEAQPYVDALERVGILHRSGGEAAKFILSLGHDVAGWWNKPEVQSAREDFVVHYANFSSDWKKQWEREFEGLIDGGMQR
jgi:putative transferase (TIGR04331 family)